MSVTTEILRTYRRPRAVVQQLFAAVASDDRPEARGFVYLLLGCFIIFCGRLPGMLLPGRPPPGMLLPGMLLLELNMHLRMCTCSHS